MKRLLASLLLLAGTALAQSPLVPFTTNVRRSYTAVTTDTGVSTIGSGTAWYVVSWNAVNAPATCTFTVDTSPDNITFTTGAILPTQSCTTTGQAAIVNVTANYFRIAVSAISGTNASVTIDVKGYGVNPNAARVVSILGAGSTFDAGTISTTETSLGVAPTIAAGTFKATNSTISMIVSTDINTPATATTFLFQLRLDSTAGTLLWKGVLQTPVINASHRVGGSEFIFTCISGCGTATAGIDILGNGTGTSGLFQTSSTVVYPVTIDSTVSHTLVMTITFGAATAGNTVQQRMAILRALN